MRVFLLILCSFCLMATSATASEPKDGDAVESAAEEEPIYDCSSVRTNRDVFSAYMKAISYDVEVGIDLQDGARKIDRIVVDMTFRCLTHGGTAGEKRIKELFSTSEQVITDYRDRGTAMLHDADLLSVALAEHGSWLRDRTPLVGEELTEARERCEKAVNVSDVEDLGGDANAQLIDALKKMCPAP